MILLWLNKYFYDTVCSIVILFMIVCDILHFWTPPLLWTTTSEQVQAILFDIDTAFVPADELNRVRAVLSYAQGKTGLAPSPQGILKYLIQLLY